jgi:hypothetical protein
MLQAGRFLLGLLTLYAVNMIIVTPAFAGGEYAVNEEALETSEAIESVSSTDKLESKIIGVPVFLACDEGLSSKSIIEPEGKSENGLQFKNCRLVENTNGKKAFLTACTIKEPVELKFKGELIKSNENALKGSGIEESFAEIKVESEKCALKGTYKIKGSQSCEMPEGELEKLIHEAICSPAGSKLSLGSEAAQFFDNEVLQLKSRKLWSLDFKAPLFQSVAVGQRNEAITVDITQLAGTKTTLELENNEGRVECKNTEYANYILNQPVATIAIEPTFTGCDMAIGIAEAPATVTTCKKIVIGAVYSLNFPEECKFEAELEPGKICIITMKLQTLLTDANIFYVKRGHANEEEIETKITASGVKYKASTGCAVFSGNGEYKETLRMKGEKGVQVGIERSA